MKIVVIGAGKIGRSIIKSVVAEGHNITIVDKDSQIINRMVETYDVLGLCGNGASLEIQKEAGVSNADLVIAVTNSDEVNIISCLLAHKIGAKDTIARVRNPEYMEQVDFMKEDLSLSMTINPEYETAKIIARHLTLPGAIKVEEFAKGKIELVELQVKENSILNGASLIDLRVKYHLQVLICSVQRGDDVIIPTGDFILKENDRVNVAASHANLINFFEKVSEHNKLKSILIVGGSRIAYYFAKLSETAKYDIKIIESKKERAQELCEKIPNTAIIYGDGMNHIVLEDEGIHNTDAFVTLTGTDEENIIVSMYAEKCGVKKILTKVNNSNFYDLLEGIGSASIISPKEVISNQIVSYIRAKSNSKGSNVVTLYKLVNEKVEAIEFNVKSECKLIGKALKDLEFKPNLLIAGIIRGKEVIIPGGNDVIALGDNVIVITTSTLEDLDEILR